MLCCLQSKHNDYKYSHSLTPVLQLKLNAQRSHSDKNAAAFAGCGTTLCIVQPEFHEGPFSLVDLYQRTAGGFSSYRKHRDDTELGLYGAPSSIELCVVYFCDFYIEFLDNLFIHLFICPGNSLLCDHHVSFRQ